MPTTFEIAETLLMDEQTFRPANTPAPNVSGVYCFKVDVVNNLPSAFRRNNIIYIGKGDNLARRLDQDLRATGHATFFRSIGAVLGYRPPHGTLIGRANQNNYTFSTTDKTAIIRWINEHIAINWIELDEADVSYIETALIQKYCPIFNIQGNPHPSAELEILRNECRRIART
jgi:excinuclease UvrABC nuclease subunit